MPKQFKNPKMKKTTKVVLITLGIFFLLWAAFKLFFYFDAQQ